MPKNAEKASEKAPDEPQNDSVFDFLYCDTPRIGSFLAQFDDSGHLQSLTQHESATLGIKRGFKLALGGGATFVGTGGSGTIAIEKSPSESGSESSDRVYDPLWTNARTFLDFIYDRNMIQNVSEATLGHFVLTSGNLSIIDMSLLRHILDNPILKRKLSQDEEGAYQNRSQRRSQDHRKKDLSTKELGLELMPIFPLTAQATVDTGEEFVWATLVPACLTVQAGDLLLQHGVQIPGKWHMLAILDSEPETVADEDSEPDDRLLPMAAALAGLIPSMRQVLGRPPTAYGVTPLLIFREVSG